MFLLAALLIIGAVSAQQVRISDGLEKPQTTVDADCSIYSPTSRDVVFSEGFETTNIEQIPTGWLKSTSGNYAFIVVNNQNTYPSGPGNIPGVVGIVQPFAGTKFLAQGWQDSGKGNWVISAGFSLTAGTTYTITFQLVMPGYSSPNETNSFECRIGDTPTAAAMATAHLVYSITQKIASWTLVTGTFTPTTSGTYYLWFKDSTPLVTGGYGIYHGIDDIKVEGGSGGADVTITTAVTPEGAGTVSGGGTKPSGSNFTLTATAGAGFTFEKWTPGNATTNPLELTNVTANATYTANFKSSSACPPAKDLNVVYAEDCKKATLTWGAPSKLRALMDFKGKVLDAEEGGMVAVGTDGNYFYVANWQASGTNMGRFEKYTMSGNYVTAFNIPGVQEVRSLDYDGTYFYAGSSPAAGGGEIKILDLNTQTQVGAIPNTGGGVLRHCSFDPTLDGGNGGFWVGDWTTIRSIKRDGTIINANSTVASVYGSAYDPYSDPENPCLWLFAQPAYSASPFSSRCIIQQWDIKTRKLTNFKYDTANDFNYNPPEGTAQGDLAGGACAYFGTDGVYYLAVNIQRTPNMILRYELASPPAPKEYNVYRDEVKLTLTPITATTFEDLSFDKMKAYTWSVKVACEGGGESDPVTKDMDKCYDAICKPVTAVNAVFAEETKDITITWTAPAGLIVQKYEIYEGEAKIGEATTTTHKVDVSGLAAGEYTKNYCVLPIFDATVCTGEVQKVCKDVTFTLSIKDYTNTFSIVPNPATKDITIKAYSDFNKIEVVNFLGQKVITEQNNGNTAKLDISTLTNGVYFVRISSENGTSVMKFVKQ